MKRTIISGLVSGLMVISACADGGKNESDSATTNPTGATMSAGSDSNSSTTTGASGSESDGSASASASASATAGTSTAGTTTATSTTASTTDPTGDTDTTGCTFLCMPDGGPVGTFECDIWAQDCMDGDKCNAWANDGGGAWNSTKCVPAGEDPPGSPCTVEGSGVSGLDSCELGAMCWNVDPETNEGTCVALCEGSEQACTENPGSCCGVGQTCSITNGGSLVLCLQACDPILQDCAGNGEACYPVSNSFQCAPDVSGEMGVIGDPCEFINVCDPGTFCGNPAAYPGCDPMAGGCCIPFCELDGPECVAMTECQPWYDPMDVPPGYENLGACVIPS